MKALLTLSLILIALFGFGIGGYLALYKLPVKSFTGKLASFVTIGIFATIITFVVCLAAVWPPVM